MKSIEIKENIIPDLSELILLYKSVGWSNYIDHPEMLEQAYNYSLKILSAWEGDRLIGILRVVGDGHSIIYIQDLLVLEEYQRNGIGSMLLTRVVNIYNTVYQKVLLTENTQNMIKFYEKNGFSRSDKFGCMACVSFNM